MHVEQENLLFLARPEIEEEKVMEWQWTSWPETRGRDYDGLQLQKKER